MPSASELNLLLDSCRPLSVLEMLGDDTAPEWMIYKAQALVYVDRDQEAAACLEPVMPLFTGDDLAQAKRIWSQTLFTKHCIDEGILASEAAAQAAVSTKMRARALVLAAAGYAAKACFQSAENTLREAKVLAGPEDPMILLAEGNLKVAMDERLAAREFFDRLAQCDVPWAKYYADLHQSRIALLLGDFDECRASAESALKFSDQMPVPYYVLAQLADIDEDVNQLEALVGEIARRFPRAEPLPGIQSILERRKNQQSTPEESRRRLKEFPTTMQKRNYCGPSTMDLLLRFWSSSEEFTADQIAEYVKLPHSGTPAYRMREFFHLVGFDTIRCLASIENLKHLVNAGFPAIVTQSFSEASHVSVVIGYDEAAKTIEFQDPMTHNVLAIPEAAVDQVRKLYMNSAILAFPHGKGYDRQLAQLGFVDEPSVIWTDQAELAMEKGRFTEAAALMERAVNRLPGHELSWLLLLSATLEEWRACLSATPVGGMRWGRARMEASAKTKRARARFQAFLDRARQLFPDSRDVVQLEGRGALLDGRSSESLAAFKRAGGLDGGDSRSFALLAESLFGLRQPLPALEAAQEALKHNPSASWSNVWLARCLAENQKQGAEHYARCGAELAPYWWMAHLALAEVLLQKNDQPAARRELDIAIGLAPEMPELRILHAILRAGDSKGRAPTQGLKEALQSVLPIPLRARYNGYQTLCKMMFSNRQFREAQREVRQLLRFTPDDTWALQFLGATTAEESLRRGRKGSGPGRQLRQLYARPIQLSEGKTWIVPDYLNYLDRLEGSAPALHEIERIRNEYPGNSGLLAVHARGLMAAGRSKEAADLMLQAITKPGGIPDDDALCEAVRMIVDGRGAEDGQKAILEAPVVDGSPSVEQRRRALGLVFALKKKDHGPRAVELLEEALQLNPADAPATLRLAEVLEDGERREELYHRALRLAPGWPFPRARLADYLLDQGRAAEALELVFGHQDESMEVAVSSGRALFNLGRYEESVSVLNAAMAQIAQPPSWMYACQWLAQSRNGNHEAAIRTARKALRANPRDVWWHLRIAQSLRSMGRFAAANGEAERARFEGLNWDGVLEGAYENAWDRGEYRRALELVNKQIQRESKTEGGELTETQVHKLRLLLELGFVEEATTLVDLQKPDTAKAWSATAWICLEGRAWELAEEYAKRALTIDPQNFAGQYVQSTLLLERGCVQEADQALQLLRVTHPREHDSYEDLAILRGLNGALDEALELAERGVLLGEFCPYAWATRGYVYFLRGQWDLARQDLETAWKRASIENRRHEHWFWWILASLQNRGIMAFDQRRRARREVRAEWHDQRLRQIADHLKRTSVERFRRSLGLARIRRGFGRLVRISRLARVFHAQHPQQAKEVLEEE